MLLSALSCTKESGPEAGSDELIAVGAQVAETKAMLDNEDKKFPYNSVITVYDWFDGEGTNNDKYIMSGVNAQYRGEETWTYVELNDDDKWEDSNAQYRWEEGVHKFFGWLKWDGSMYVNDNYLTPEVFFGANFKFANQVLTIPEKEMDATKDQFDFVYSEIHERLYYKSTLNSGRYVELNMKHLFTAVSIGVENSTSSFVKIEEFKIENIPDTRSATINFSGDKTAVTYSAWKNGAIMTRELGVQPYEVSPGIIRGDIFTGTAEEKYMLLWPTEAQYLHSTDKLGTDEGNVTYPTTWKMYIKYSIGNTPYEKRINFPNSSWEAGKKNLLTIVFADKMVDLKVQVKDWEYEEQNINYENETPAISYGGALSWDSNVSAVDANNKMVSIVNAQPAKAHFTLQAPTGGSWIVSLVGDVNAFEVSPASGIIDGNTAHISVKPLVSSPTRDYKVQLKFTIRRSDGRLIAADDIIQLDGAYTVVLPRNN